MTNRVRTALVRKLKVLRVQDNHIQIAIEELNIQLHKYGSKASADYSPTKCYNIFAKRENLEKQRAINKAKVDDLLSQTSKLTIATIQKHYSEL